MAVGGLTVGSTTRGLIMYQAFNTFLGSSTYKAVSGFTQTLSQSAAATSLVYQQPGYPYYYAALLNDPATLTQID